ncbi:MAG: ferric reductase-like transmembrane domain-containing protein [Paracoccaceae bacterium]
MAAGGAGRARATLIWAALVLAIAVPVIAAAYSPLLAWRRPVYIAAGFAGVLSMALILLQPLLVAGYLPGLPALRGRRVHRWSGSLLIGAVIVHVGGLWITSPPDVIDALSFTSPTPFSAWGVIAMWAVFGAALLALLRQHLRWSLRLWRFAHGSLALVTVLTGVVHALLIEGTMETVSKAILCLLVVIATLKVLADLRVWAVFQRRRT